MNYKKVLKKYFKTKPIPGILLALALIMFLVGGFVLVYGQSSNVVPFYDVQNYQDFRNDTANPGEKAFLNITGLSSPIIRTDDGLTIHIAVDKGLHDTQWLYYLIALDSETYNEEKLLPQLDYYYEETDKFSTFTIWGKVVGAGNGTISQICDIYDLTENDYFRTFGENYLKVNRGNQQVTSIGGFILIMSMLLLALSFAAKIEMIIRKRRMISFLEANGQMESASEELANAIDTGQQPLITDNYIFYKPDLGVAKIADIRLLNSTRKLCAYLVNGSMVVIAGKNRNGRHEKIIDQIREKNVDVMVGLTEENKERYNLRVRHYYEIKAAEEDMKKNN